MNYTANTLENYWMPFTANRHFKDNPRLIVRAEGVHYWDHKGEQLLDGASGMFCVAAGHGRREIAEAVARQFTDLDYSPPFQFGHPGAFELSRRLAALLPDDINYVFFGNSGSEAVDSALKIGLAYHRAKGQGQRMRFVGRERAYHGVNFGGVSVAGIVKNREAFGLGLPGVVHMRHTWMPEQRFTKGEPEMGAEVAEDLQRFVDLHGAESIALCIVEPIAGSIGCIVPPKGYLARLREICDEHGILLIFDEVITGLGRTGKAFAAESFGVTPDMITMAKALTNGNVPMAPSPCAMKSTRPSSARRRTRRSSSFTATPTRRAPSPSPPASPRSIFTATRGCSSAPPSFHPTSSTPSFRSRTYRPSPTSVATACSPRSTSRQARRRGRAATSCCSGSSRPA